MHAAEFTRRLSYALVWSSIFAAVLFIVTG